MSIKSKVVEHIFEDINFNGKHVLDAGTGNGLFTVKLVQKIGKAKGDRMVTSIDLDETKFDNVRSRLQGQQGKYIEFIKADLASLSFIDDNSYDIIFAHHVISRINTRPLKAAQALYEFYRVLKPGSHLIINELYPLNHSQRNEYKNFIRLNKLKRMISIVLETNISSRIYPEDLAYILQKVGFEKTSIKAFQDQMFHIKLFESVKDEIKTGLEKIEDEKVKNYLRDELKDIEKDYRDVPGVIPPQYVIKLEK